jgi:hypothetical protein
MRNKAVNWYKKAKLSNYWPNFVDALKSNLEKTRTLNLLTGEELLEQIASYNKYLVLSVIKGLKNESYSDVDIDDVDDVLFLMDDDDLRKLLKALERKAQ